MMFCYLVQIKVLSKIYSFNSQHNLFQVWQYLTWQKQMADVKDSVGDTIKQNFPYMSASS